MAATELFLHLGNRQTLQEATFGVGGIGSYNCVVVGGKFACCHVEEPNCHPAKFQVILARLFLQTSQNVTAALSINSPTLLDKVTVHKPSD